MSKPSASQLISATEFLAIPETLEPMELLNGAIIMSPSPEINHQEIVLHMGSWLLLHKPDGRVMVTPSDVHWDDSNVTQPDVFWISVHNSRCQPIDGKHWQGVPDLVIEALSPSTAIYDKQNKFRLYEKYGVQEYWIIDPEHRFIEVWVHHETRFVLQDVYGVNDQLTSRVLGGATLIVQDIFPE